MSEINEKMISEFLELLKKVNSLEMQVQNISKDHDESITRATKIAQSMQNSITEALSKQNELVTSTNNNLASQVNDAMSRVNSVAHSAIINHLHEHYPSDRLAVIIEQINSLDYQVKNLTKIIRNITKAFQHAKTLEEKEVENPVLSTDIGDHDLDFCMRTINALRAENINTIGELIKYPANLLKIPNFGKKSLREVMYTLNKLGLTLEHGNCK